MEEATAMARLPEVYAAALRLRSRDIDEDAIAAELGLEREAVGPLLRLAETKLQALLAAPEPKPARAVAAPTPPSDAPHPSRPGLSPEEVAAIERAAEEYMDTMRAGDWKLVARSFTADAVRIPPHEQPHRGREAIEAWLGAIDDVVAYELARDALVGVDGLAYARGRYAITLRLRGVRDPISDEGDFLEVWRKEPAGRWRAAEAIWNTRRPLPPLAPGSD
jgi:ketosteroid isomerase-like protein